MVLHLLPLTPTEQLTLVFRLVFLHVSWQDQVMIMLMELPLTYQETSMWQEAPNGGLDGNTSAGNTDLFVVKYSSSGTKQWTNQFGSSSRDSANGVAPDSSGNVYVTGMTNGGLDGCKSAGVEDLFVVKYNASGTKQWTNQLGSSSRDSANDSCHRLFRKHLCDGNDLLGTGW